jgi:DNA-binding HxlR family transcriptional regulator
MREPQPRSDCPISTALDLFGDKWSLLVMRDLLFRHKAHYREFLASEEGISTNILADRLGRLEAAGLIEKSQEDRRSGKQVYVPTAKGAELIPVLLQMMLWSAKHNPHTNAPAPLIAALEKDLQKTADAIRKQGGLTEASPPARTTGS